jgi:phosphotriesterase-related protein
MVSTATGLVAPEKLGITLMHEHVLYGKIPDDLRADSIEFALTLLQDAARVGVDTLVCMSPERDIRLYQQIAERSPVKIIASTGAYIYSRMPKFIQEMNEQQMYVRIVREVTEGIDGTKVRAGIIKAAGAKTPLTEWEKAAFRAAGRAQKTTQVHSELDTGTYPAGIKVPDRKVARIDLSRDKFHGEWNYTIHPREYQN